MARFRVVFAVCIVLCLLLAIGSYLQLASVLAQTPEDEWIARPMHVAELMNPMASVGYTPSQVRAAYGLPATGGAGTTIAIVNAYDSPSIWNDLTIFSNRYGLPAPSSSNFEIKKMATSMSTNSGWAQETALDVEWVHAIAPEAKILLVEAKSAYRDDLLAAVDYARGRADVVAVSMSWGSNEFYNQASYNYRFTSNYGAVFFAASGDDGSGVIWPSSSSNVVAVGGTTLYLDSDGSVISETGWSGSGGGISKYEPKPTYQANFGISGARRTVPDVSYNADPSTGFPVYCNSQWYRVGGTSAGSPQWAAIHALGRSATNTNFYSVAKTPANVSYFRDITSGTNGGYNAATGYDYVTGLGSPLTTSFVYLGDTDSITLLPAGESMPLNSTNQFQVNYTLNGATRTTWAGAGTTTINVDRNTNLTIAGTSLASTYAEKWVFNENGSPVTAKNGTLYYYHILSQNVNYTVAGGGTPLSPTLNYLTAPSIAGSQSTPSEASITLSQSPRTIWALSGTAASATNPIDGDFSERWFTPFGGWTITSPNLLRTLLYYHQYYVTIDYQMMGGASPVAPTLRATGGGTVISQDILPSGTSLWLDANTHYSLTSPLASNSTDRWVAAEPNGIINGPLTVIVNYYHQVSIPVSCSIEGDGYPASPNLSYSIMGNIATIQLAINTQVIWVDSGSEYSATPTLEGSNETERWFSHESSGIIQKAPLNLTYDHQFLLNVTGAALDSQWFNGNEVAQVRIPGVFNRVSKVGQRITAYAIDNGPIINIEPTVDTMTVFFSMNNTSHLLQITTKTQYEVMLDNSGFGILNYITPPTISGDAYWYDEGTQVRLILNGISDRSSGAGQRVSSYSVNGISTNVATTGQVAVINIPITEAKTVSVTITDQYHLSTLSGSFKSATPSSISQDQGWYDSGTQITVTYDHTLASTQDQSRQNAVSYMIDNGQPVLLGRTGSGTFSLQLAMTKPQTITVSSVTQYPLTVSGGSNIICSQNSPTGDNYFDSATNLTISTDSSWGSFNGKAKQTLTSYNLDSSLFAVPTNQTGRYTTAMITMDSPHELVFNSKTEYLVSFAFTEESGTSAIIPTSLQIRTEGNILDVPPNSLWLDAGTQFEIESIIWQNSEVKPEEGTSYTVNAPADIAIGCRIYNGKIVVNSHLGIPVQGAQVVVTLANQTTVQAVTSSDGSVNLPLIPRGLFNASITYSGASILIAGDASTQPVTVGALPSPAPSFSPSIPEVTLIIAAATLFAATCTLALANRNKKTKDRLK